MRIVTFWQRPHECPNPKPCDLSALEWWLIKNMDSGARLPGFLHQPHHVLAV